MQLLLLKESTTRPRLQSSSIVAVHGVVRTVHGDWGGGADTLGDSENNVNPSSW